MSLPLSSCRNRRVEVFISIKPSSSAHHEHGGKTYEARVHFPLFGKNQAPHRTTAAKDSPSPSAQMVKERPLSTITVMTMQKLSIVGGTAG